ncbi:hypothetical protein GLU64_01285 [Nanohaloarchaea archaeon]|nr:hypothetical protein [Candidatus Nanohaloarchaea archaeon]
MSTKKDEIGSVLEPDAREELSQRSLQNLVENTLENPGFGMEEEAQVLLPDLSTIDRRHQEAIYTELQEIDEVEKNDEGELEFHIGEQNHGVKPAVVWDMGANEYESTIPPMEDPERVEAVANTLVERTRKAAHRAYENGRIEEAPDIYRLGQNPGMSDEELAEEVGEEFTKSNFEGEDPETGQHNIEKKSKDASRYVAHASYLVNEHGEPEFGKILGSSSHQVTGLFQFEPYIKGDVKGRELESVEDAFNKLQSYSDQDGVNPEELDGEVAEAYEEVSSRLETAFADLQGSGPQDSGPFASFNRLSPFFTLVPKANSPGFVQKDGEEERIRSDRMHNYRDFEDLKPVDTPKALSHPLEQEVESMDDWVDLKANLNGEFGPEREAGDIQVAGEDTTVAEKYEVDPDTTVVTSFSPEEGEKKSFAEAVNDGYFTGLGVFEKGDEKVTEKVKVDEFAQENLEAAFDLQVSGAWPSVRYRPSVGAFEVRDIPTTENVSENFTLGAAALKKSHDIQYFFRELGYDNMGWEEGMEHRMGIADKAGNYQITVENAYGDEVEATAGELFCGSDEVEFGTEYDSLLDILAEGADELAGEKYGKSWQRSMASSTSPPADDYHDDENGIRTGEIEPANTGNTVQKPESRN